MILKGGSRGNPKQLAYHLQRVDTNERVTILELQHPIKDLEEAFYCWQALSEGSPRAKKGLYHLNIDPHERYEMTPEKWQRAVEIAEKQLGFEGQSRCVVLHEKDGREHIHVVWCRMDYEAGRLRSDSQNYLKHEKASLAMEREFGHQHVPGKHTKRDREKQSEFPRAEYNHTEWQQAERGGLDARERKAQIRALQAAAGYGQEFKEVLEKAGYVLAQGERGYLIVDQAGDHSALSRNLGLKKAQLKAFMAGIPLDKLPTIEEARERQEASALEAPRRAHTAEAPLPASHDMSFAERKEQITAIRKPCDDAQAFGNALEEAGYVLAKGDKRREVLHFKLTDHPTAAWTSQ